MKIKCSCRALAVLVALFRSGASMGEESLECERDHYMEIAMNGDRAKAMGIANEVSFGVCRDAELERFWLRVAALLGSDEAMGSLGEVLIRPGRGTAEWYEGISLLMRSSDKGNSVSSSILADALGENDDLAPVDQRRYWLIRSAEQGSTAAMTELARDELKAVPRDEVRLAEALRWVTLACRQSIMGSVSHKDACAVRDALRTVTASGSASSE